MCPKRKSNDTMLRMESGIFIILFRFGFVLCRRGQPSLLRSQCNAIRFVTLCVSELHTHTHTSILAQRLIQWNVFDVNDYDMIWKSTRFFPTLAPLYIRNVYTCIGHVNNSIAFWLRRLFFLIFPFLWLILLLNYFFFLFSFVFLFGAHLFALDERIALTWHAASWCCVLNARGWRRKQVAWTIDCFARQITILCSHALYIRFSVIVIIIAVPCHFSFLLCFFFFLFNPSIAWHFTLNTFIGQSWIVGGDC